MAGYRLGKMVARCGRDEVHPPHQFVRMVTPQDQPMECSGTLDFVMWSEVHVPCTGSCPVHCPPGSPIHILP